LRFEVRIIAVLLPPNGFCHLYRRLGAPERIRNIIRLIESVCVDDREGVERDLFEVLMRAQSRYDQAEADKRDAAREQLENALKAFADFCNPPS
jgi:hypothetical protein